MKRKFQVRFLGGSGAERLPSYPVRGNDETENNSMDDDDGRSYILCGIQESILKITTNATKHVD